MTKPAKTAKTGVAAPTTFPDKLERHPLSEKYGPPLTQEEMLGLATDIEKHGQHDAILTYEGKVLAGWNRYMACLQKNVKPILKEYDGKEPEAVAFGTNVIRRRMSSVQKAFLGAQFALDTGAKQTDVAKMCAVSLNRLNQCCQLLKLETPEAEKAISAIRTNPEVTGGAFEEIMLECGIARIATPKPQAAGAPLRSNTHAGDDDDDLLGGDDDLGGFDVDDDLTGGAIDGLLDTDPGSDTLTEPTQRTRKHGLDNDSPIGDVGGRRDSMKNPHETQVSRVAKAFRGLSAAEQQQFVKFAWAKLKGALDAAITAMEVDYTPPDVDESAKPAPKTKGKAKEETTKADNGIADIANALTGAKKPPASKPARPDIKVPAKAPAPAPAAKKAAPAKKASPAKAPAKKTAKK